MRAFFRFLLLALFASIGSAVSAQDIAAAKRKCVEWGFKQKTAAYEDCVRQNLKTPGSGAPPKAPAPGLTDSYREDVFWADTRKADNKTAYEAYLKQYPRGRYAGLARANLTRLSEEIVAPKQSEPTPVERQGMALGQTIKDCADCPEMVVIPAGSFTMGSSAAEQALAVPAGLPETITRRESPQYQVSIRSFAAGRYAISKVEFAAFVRAKSYQTEAERGDGCAVFNGKDLKRDAAYNWRNVGFVQTDNHPVVCVSWNDAQAYIGWLNQTSGQTYRLLSEAEREYATRGGSQSAFWWGDSISTAQANYGGTGPSYNGSPKGEYRQATVPVNSFSPNPFGLYNVHGNVWEWVEDCWHDNYTGAPTDGSAWTTGCSENTWVLRGGSWIDDPSFLRSAFRNRGTPDDRYLANGFRLARTLLTP